jgi:hypothetical protein
LDRGALQSEPVLYRYAVENPIVAAAEDLLFRRRGAKSVSIRGATLRGAGLSPIALSGTPFSLGKRPLEQHSGMQLKRLKWRLINYPGAWGDRRIQTTKSWIQGFLTLRPVFVRFCIFVQPLEWSTPVDLGYPVREPGAAAPQGAPCQPFPPGFELL